MSEKIWFNNGSTYQQGDVMNSLNNLPLGIYNLEFDQIKGFYLTLLEETFEFPYKIYDKEDAFIERVKKTYDNTGTNLGVLLSGLKGTGKTVTGKLIANLIGNPVILVTTPYGGMKDYINSINQDLTLFFDEFEKIYAGDMEFDDDYSRQHALLTFMDGVLNSSYRRMFILTTNEKHIDPNFMERPSRIRYIKPFTDLKLDTIMEVIDDMLLYPGHRQACIDFISHLNIITIDIVKSVINEVNIHNESPESFKDIFNVKESFDSYDIWLVEDEKGSKTKYAFDVDASRISPKPEDMLGERGYDYEGGYLHIKGRIIGYIREIFDDIIEVECHNKRDAEGNPVVIKLEFSKISKTHLSFSNMAF